MPIARRFITTLPWSSLLSLAACVDGTGQNARGLSGPAGNLDTTDDTVLFQRYDDQSQDFAYGSLDGHAHTVRRIGFGYQDATALSPDGKQLAYMTFDGDPGRPLLAVGQLDRPQAEDVVVAEQASSPSFSPDGSQLAFVGAVFQPGQTIGRISLYAVASAGGTASAIDLLAQQDPTGVTLHPARCNAPTWSPDGTQIAFATDTGVNLYSFADHTLHPLVPSGSAAWTCDARWSPDGAAIAYTAGDAAGQAHLIRTSAACTTGGAPVAIAAVDGAAGDVQFRWSPDGASIAYAEHGAAGYAIRTVDAAGGVPATLDSITGDGYLGVPAWSPDGTTLLYSVFDGTPGASSHLATLAIAGGTRTVQAPTMFMAASYYAWLPTPIPPSSCGE